MADLVPELLLSWLQSPLTFAFLAAVAVLCFWVALTPSASLRQVQSRLGDYVEAHPTLEDSDMRQSLLRRVVLPLLRRLLRLLGRLAPKYGIENTRRLLLRAGEPFGLGPLDFLGVRLLLAILLGGGYLIWASTTMAVPMAARNALLIALVAFFIPWLWLRTQVSRRQYKIARALPDALDMLTIAVEAGLPFESALLRVGTKWDNALTREFRRAVAEMRVGTARDVALQRMADRAGVPDLSVFVAVLIQSNQLGVSIAHVLHSQAAEMRIKRRQRAQELAQQASVKMVFPLVFLIFPAVMVVVLGPAIPTLIDFFRQLGQ